MRPAPISPHACSPLPGPQISTLRAFNVAKLACVAACAYICWFMAGATATFAGVASSNVVSRSSAMPAAILAIILHVAGATKIKSAHFANSICPIEASAEGSSNESETVSPLTACMVSGVIKCLADSVITTFTSQPESFNRLTSSAHL